MKNIEELRSELANIFNGLKSGDVEPKVAAELNNSAGKMINTVKVELEYAALRKKQPKIDFLEY